MTTKSDPFARLSFIPYLLALSAGVTWYAHKELFERVDEWSLWTYVWGPGRAQLEPRHWASWTLGVIIFMLAFEMFRRFDWFFRPTPGSALPDPTEKNNQGEDDGNTPRKPANEARDKERQRVREERKRERARKREEDKARREQDKADDLRKRAERAAKERARKVSEAAEETFREEDRQVELEHGKALGLQGKLTPDEIKKKYRELMTQYHPDKVRNMGDEIREVAERKAKEINEAYDYFRKKYDL